MTEQEMFDKSVTGQRAQGGKSTDAHGGCRLRGINGRKCAVGHVIPDDRYDEAHEGYTVGDLLDGGALDASLYPHGDLLVELQMIHDQYETDSWEVMWDELAARYNIEMPKG